MTLTFEYLAAIPIDLMTTWVSARQTEYEETEVREPAILDPQWRMFYAVRSENGRRLRPAKDPRAALK
jgi:hypothetical protein